MANKRLFYAVYQVGLSICGLNTFTALHGLQSVGLSTAFNLESIFEVGQIEVYELVENIPSIEATLEKVLDGYPPIYLQATKGSTAPSLAGRSNVKCTLGLSTYSDVQDSASGTPLSQMTASGMYVSALTWTFPVNGNFTESVTLVGNNKLWSNAFTDTEFLNNDVPLAYTSGLGGVNRRENLVTYPLTAGGKYTIFPIDIPGISASGTNNKTAGDFNAHVQSIRVSTNLGREELFELGRRGPYHRFISFPVEVRSDWEVLDLQGDNVQALEDAVSNITDRTIAVYAEEGTYLNLGTKNKLSNVQWGGANAGQNGGNATSTFSYTNFNSLAVTHPQDPSGL